MLIQISLAAITSLLLSQSLLGHLESAGKLYSLTKLWKSSISCLSIWIPIQLF